MSVIRKARTSKKQYVIYVEYLEEHPILRSGKLSPRTTPEDLHNLWVQLVNALNACGDGPTRDVDAWKKVFTEWKSQTRKKAREGKVLNVLEERLLKVTGVIVVDGAPGVPELGVPDEVQQVMHTVQDLEIEYLDDQHIEPTIGSEAPNIEVASLVESENKAKDNQKKICRKKKKGSSALLEAYEADQRLQREGLANIATSLQSIADGINRLCNILDK